MKVEKVMPDTWKRLAPLAHKIAFDEILIPENDRIDFALFATVQGAAAAYVTCREVDADSLYWAYGGALPTIKDTVLSWKAYSAMTDFCRNKYKRIYTLIENTNIVMLKFAMKMGYKIIGIKNYKGAVLLEHVLEF